MNVDHFGDGQDRVPLIDVERHGFRGSDLELAGLVGQHQSPLEALADDETDEDAARRLRGHGAIGELAFGVVIGIALPHAGDEGRVDRA